ncbi:hypothetical protein ENTCAN_06026 [Enterobacter cancerogenus ATCC 35316]|nr:hypothetical protein ENTCAN_06026 [Enterobacter cancerogenus ATCC 35316]
MSFVIFVSKPVVNFGDYIWNWGGDARQLETKHGVRHDEYFS